MKNFLVKTKGSFRLNSREPRGKKYLLWVCGAFVVLFFFKDAVGMATSYATTSLYGVRHYFLTSSATIPVFLRSRIELEKQIQLLEQELASQKGTDATLAFVTNENEELRTLLNASSTERIGAGVIARPPYSPYDTILLDKGSDDGVVMHAPVYHGKGIAIGYVRQVFSQTALVTLFSSPDVETTVFVFGPNLFTTAYGEGGGVVRLSVPQGITIEEGDVVVLPSIESGALGIISEIQSIPTEPEQHAFVTLPAPLQSLRLVAVGKSPVEHISFPDAQLRVEEAEKKLFTIPIPEDERIWTVGTTSLSETVGATTSTSTAL